MTISRKNVKNQDSGFILELYKRPETVFRVDEIAQLHPHLTPLSLRSRLYYFTKAGKIERLRHGIYAKPKYEPLELANKLYKPSYISLETVLAKNSVVFQYYETIFVTSYLTRTVQVRQVSLQYRQIKSTILTNSRGIARVAGYNIATLERAFLDAVYIYKNYHFDNLRPLDWDKVNDLVEIYQNQSLLKRVAEYYKLYKEENG